MEKSRFDPAIYLSILKELAAISPPLYIMGGFAEEALLDGRITTQHADLDVLATPDQITRHIQSLTDLGLVRPVGVHESTPGRPLVLAIRTIKLDLELWRCTLEPDGIYALELDNQMPHNHFIMWMPVDTFQYPASMVDGIPIQTVSPLALYLLRAASAMTRHTGEKRLKDLAVQDRLHKAFLAGIREEKLSPRLEFFED